MLLSFILCISNNIIFLSYWLKRLHFNEKVARKPYKQLDIFYPNRPQNNILHGPRWYIVRSTDAWNFSSVSLEFDPRKDAPRTKNDNAKSKRYKRPKQKRATHSNEKNNKLDGSFSNWNRLSPVSRRISSSRSATGLSSTVTTAFFVFLFCFIDFSEPFFSRFIIVFKTGLSVTDLHWLDAVLPSRARTLALGPRRVWLLSVLGEDESVNEIKIKVGVLTDRTRLLCVLRRVLYWIVKNNWC